MTPAIGASFEGLPPSPRPPPATSSKKMPTPCLVFHLSHTSLTALLFMHFEYFLQIDIGTVVVSLFNSPPYFTAAAAHLALLLSSLSPTFTAIHTFGLRVHKQWLAASPPLSFCSIMFLYLQIIKVSKKTPTF